MKYFRIAVCLTINLVINILHCQQKDVTQRITKSAWIARTNVLKATTNKAEAMCAAVNESNLWLLVNIYLCNS